MHLRTLLRHLLHFDREKYLVVHYWFEKEWSHTSHKLHTFEHEVKVIAHLITKKFTRICIQLWCFAPRWIFFKLISCSPSKSVTIPLPSLFTSLTFLLLTTYIHRRMGDQNCQSVGIQRLGTMMISATFCFPSPFLGHLQGSQRLEVLNNCCVLLFCQYLTYERPREWAQNTLWYLWPIAELVCCQIDLKIILPIIHLIFSTT